MNTSYAEDIAYIVRQGGNIKSQTRVGGEILVVYESEKEIPKKSNLSKIEIESKMTVEDFINKYGLRFENFNNFNKNIHEYNTIELGIYDSLNGDSYHVSYETNPRGEYRFYRSYGFFKLEEFKYQCGYYDISDLYRVIMQFESDRGLI